MSLQVTRSTDKEKKKRSSASMVVTKLFMEKKWRFIGLIATLLTVAILNPVEAYAFSQIINLYTAGQLTWNSLQFWGSICLMIPLVVVILTLFQNHLTTGMQDYLQVQLAVRLQERMFLANPSMLESQHGDTDKVLTDTSREVSRVALYIPWLATPMITIICYLVACILVDLRLGLLCVIPILLCVLSSKFWSKIKRLGEKKKKARMAMLGFVRETTDNIRSIQHCQNAKKRSIQFGEIGKQFMQTNREMLFPRFYASTMFTGIATLLVKGMILIFGMWVWRLPVGSLFQLWNYMTHSVNSLSQVNTYFTKLLEIKASFKVLSQLWDAETYKVEANPCELNHFRSYPSIK
jgi:ABC-type multidrug transport system fused ATPase/permease subunit